MINIANQLEIEGYFLKTIKGIYEKFTANIVVTGERLSFPPKIRTKTIPDLSASIKYCTESSSQ